MCYANLIIIKDIIILKKARRKKIVKKYYKYNYISKNSLNIKSY